MRTSGYIDTEMPKYKGVHEYTTICIVLLCVTPFDPPSFVLGYAFDGTLTFLQSDCAFVEKGVCLNIQ